MADLLAQAAGTLDNAVALVGRLPGGRIVLAAGELALAVPFALERRLRASLVSPASLHAELRRIAEAVEAVPALREDMTDLPRSISGLEERMAELLGTINALMQSVEGLAEATAPLRGAEARLAAVEQRERAVRRWFRGPGAHAPTS